MGDDHAAGPGALRGLNHSLPPALGNVTVDGSGGEIVFKADFTDAGVRDTHTATIDWGDGVSGPATLTESNGSGTVSGRHTYGAPGVYTINFTVVDDEGASVSRGVGITVGGGGLSNSPPTVLPGTYQTSEGGGSILVQFTDADSLDTHTSTIDWGDGSPATKKSARVSSNPKRLLAASAAPNPTSTAWPSVKSRSMRPTPRRRM